MKRLLQLRKSRGLSQGALAEILHVSQQSICKYETGKAEPDISTLKKIASYFNTSIDYLVEYEDRNDTEGKVDLLIEGSSITHNEINHLIRYRKLNDSSKRNIDELITALNR